MSSTTAVKLSLITATHPDTNQYLRECAAAIAALSLPERWKVEWCLQEDGPGSSTEELQDIPFVRYESNGRSMGIAATRNLALRRSTGQYVRCLDADDLILREGTIEVLEELEKTPALAWGAGAAIDLLDDGSKQPFSPNSYSGIDATSEEFRSLVNSGVIPPGSICDVWDSTGVFPIHCAGLTVRRHQCIAVGGWAAQSRSEDISMAVALSEIWPGYVSQEPSFYYRRWAGQTTRLDDWIGERDRAHDLVKKRVEALRATGLSKRAPRA